MFGGSQKKRLPSYVLTTRLPGTLGPLLLGRIVADFENPTDEYCPDDPRETLKSEYLDIVDADVSVLTSATKDSTTKAELGKILGWSSDKTDGEENSLESSYVRTRSMAQHRRAFQALLKAHREEMIQLLRNNKRRAYMVVGFKTAADAKRVGMIEGSRRRFFAAEFPTAAAVQGVSHGAVSLDGEMVDPKLQHSSSSGHRHEESSSMEGEQIFAIRYRIIKLGRRDKTAEPEYGEIQRVEFEAGVYGPDEGEIIFEEEDEDSEGNAEGEGEDEGQANDDEIAETATLSNEVQQDTLEWLGKEDTVILLMPDGPDDVEREVDPSVDP